MHLLYFLGGSIIHYIHFLFHSNLSKILTSFESLLMLMKQDAKKKVICDSDIDASILKKQLC